MRRTFFKYTLTIVLLASLCACGRPKDGVLFDFEEEKQLDGLIWRCPVNMERTPAISGRGAFALTAYLLPGLYPGVEFHDPPSNWSGYSALEFYIRAPEAAGQTLHIRIDDTRSNEDFYSRYQGYRKLTGDTQRIVIPFDEIRKNPHGRELNLRRVRRIVIYLYRQEKRVEMTLDDLRLIQQP